MIDAVAATPALVAGIYRANGKAGVYYGNKFGEPLVLGYCRSLGLPDDGTGKRVEWLKPVMFSAGAGWLDSRHCLKHKAERGMLVAKVGGPAYRIGMGGGAASSHACARRAGNRGRREPRRGEPRGRVALAPRAPPLPAPPCR